MRTYLARNWSWLALTFAVGGLAGTIGVRIVTKGNLAASEGFIDALVGAVVGGVFTLLGGLLGAAYLGTAEREARVEDERKELEGSAILVYTELAHNIGLIAVMAGADENVRFPIDLSASTFPQVQTALARGLPLTLLAQLQAAYGVLQVAEARIASGRRQGRLVEAERMHLAQIAHRLSTAQHALGDHLQINMGYVIPPMEEQEIREWAVRTGQHQPAQQPAGPADAEPHPAPPPSR